MSPLNQRPPFTTDELENFTAEDLVRYKLTAEEKARLKQINSIRSAKRMQEAIRLQAEEKPIIDDLNSIGFQVSSVWDLVNTQVNYKGAIPLLISHLQRPYSDRIKEGIARSLAVTYANEWWDVIAAEYLNVNDKFEVVDSQGAKTYKSGYKDGLAAALSASALESNLEELINLAKNPKHGESRILLLGALKKRRFKSKFVDHALKLLVTDPQLKKEIESWK